MLSDGTTTRPMPGAALRQVPGAALRQEFGGALQQGPGADARAVPQREVVDERALLAALRAGDPDAFETVVRVFGGRLLAVARRLTRNEDDARDAVQSAYLSALNALPEFEGTARFSTWLHRIVVNNALMMLRSRRRRPEESIEVLLPSFREDGHHVEQFTEWDLAADQLIERAETRAIVRREIDRLPEIYRTVLVLRDIEDLSTEEVAGMLRLTKTAVKVRLHRARQALATLLRPHFAPAEAR